MQNNRLGCLTGTGLFAAIVTIVAVVGMFFFNGSQMFSAGALNGQTGDLIGGVNSHAQITECNACHTAPWENVKMAKRCMNCHQDVSAQLNSTSELHGVIARTSPNTSCRECHPEHRGAFASLTELAGNFNHDQFTFPLVGKHVRVTCEKCHINEVFKGTPSDCYSCHKQNDKHNGKFGTDCSSCHNANSWSDATFDHNRTNFPLNGGHAGVACGQCHRNQVFTGLSTDCVSCHADPAFHIGAFKQSCTECHNSTAWSPAQFNLPHPEPRTDEGGSGITHGNATCRQCHPSTVREAICTDCHDSNNFGGN